jgi:hypothetical protein
MYAEVKRPMNLNDSDLFPGMKEVPKEHEGATEMMFFLARCHIGEFLKAFANKKSTFDGVWNSLSTDAVTLATKNKAIDELEAMYERKFLRYCDHSVAWHYMCTYLIKAILAMLRFIAHNPEHHGGSKEDIPQTEKDKLFRLAVQIVTFQNMCYTMKEMQGYLWHINSHFQWKGFIYLVVELKDRTQGEEVDEAWKQVEQVFEFHPSFGQEFSTRALSIAVTNFTLRAFDAYVAARGLPNGKEPLFIQILRRRVSERANTPSSSSRSLSQTHSEPHTTLSTTTPNAFIQPQVPAPVPVHSTTHTDTHQAFQWDAGFADSLDPTTTVPDLPLLDLDQINWEHWDTLVADFETQGNGPGGFSTNGGGWEYGMQ